jgi:hypothetical protein
LQRKSYNIAFQADIKMEATITAFEADIKKKLFVERFI